MPTEHIPPERQHLSVEMRKGGYHTAMIGKWNLKKEPAAFDYYCVLPGQGKYFNADFREAKSTHIFGTAVLRRAGHR